MIWYDFKITLNKFTGRPREQSIKQTNNRQTNRQNESGGTEWGRVQPTRSARAVKDRETLGSKSTFQDGGKRKLSVFTNNSRRTTRYIPA